MNHLEKLFDRKNVHIGEHMGRSLAPFGLMPSSREQKRRCFLSVRNARVRVLFLHQFGRPWVQNIGFVDTFDRLFYFLNFGLKRENLKKKGKKSFWMGKNSKHGYFCVTPTGLPDNFSGFYYLFPVRRHASDVPSLTDKLCRS